MSLKSRKYWTTYIFFLSCYLLFKVTFCFAGMKGYLDDLLRFFLFLFFTYFKTTKVRINRLLGKVDWYFIF